MAPMTKTLVNLKFYTVTDNFITIRKISSLSYVNFLVCNIKSIPSNLDNFVDSLDFHNQSITVSAFLKLDLQMILNIHIRLMDSPSTLRLKTGHAEELPSMYIKI